MWRRGRTAGSHPGWHAVQVQEVGHAVCARNQSALRTWHGKGERRAARGTRRWCQVPWRQLPLSTGSFSTRCGPTRRPSGRRGRPQCSVWPYCSGRGPGRRDVSMRACHKYVGSKHVSTCGVEVGSGERKVTCLAVHMRAEESMGQVTAWLTACPHTHQQPVQGSSHCLSYHIAWRLCHHVSCGTGRMLLRICFLSLVPCGWTKCCHGGCVRRST